MLVPVDSRFRLAEGAVGRFTILVEYVSTRRAYSQTVESVENAEKTFYERLWPTCSLNTR